MYSLIFWPEDKVVLYDYLITNLSLYMAINVMLIEKSIFFSLKVIPVTLIYLSE